jgi:hypothetical protein
VPSVQRLAVYTGEALDELEAVFVRRPEKLAKAAPRRRAAPRGKSAKAAAARKGPRTTASGGSSRRRRD